MEEPWPAQASAAKSWDEHVMLCQRAGIWWVDLQQADRDALQVAAHSFRATWVGDPIRLNERPLKAFDKTAAQRIAGGVARNEAIWDIVTPATMSVEWMDEINRIARGE